VSEEQKDYKTSYLGQPHAEPMPEERERQRETARITDDTKLQIKVGDKKGIVEISDTMLIGRHVEGDPTEYAIDLGPYGGYQSGVSRKHALITNNEGGLYIEDLGSTNGTRINGFQLTLNRKYRLRDGDEVEFARLRTQFKFIDGKTESEPETDAAE
jgi:pSer/pThr/pTyr-binding forkhead associated (FHA) protein